MATMTYADAAKQALAEAQENVGTSNKYFKI